MISNINTTDIHNTLIPKLKTSNKHHVALYRYCKSYVFKYDSIEPVYIDDTTEYNKYFENEYRKLKRSQLKEQLNKSPSIKRFNDKFLNDVGLSYYHNISDDLKNNYDIDKLENLNNIINIKQIDFINNIYETYPTNEDIIKQFTLDFHRHKVYVNNNLCMKIDDLFIILSKYNRHIDISPNKKTTIFMLSLLLICQSSFYISFLHIHNKINKMKENYILTKKISVYNTDHIPLLNYHVTDTSNNKVIRLTIDDLSLCCSFMASYKIINIYTEKIIHNLNSETIFDLNFDDCLIVYDTY